MPSDAKKKLHTKILRFFKAREINIGRLNIEEFVDYIYQESLKEERIKESEKFRLHPKYIIHTLTAYLNEQFSTVLKTLRKPREKRPSTSYECLLPETSAFNSSRDIITNLGTKKKTEHKFTKADGTALEEENIARIRDKHPDFKSSFSPVTLLQDDDENEKVRPRAKSRDNSVYDQVLSTRELTWWKKMTPYADKNSPYRLEISEELRESYEDVRNNLSDTFNYEKNKYTIKEFSFEVTRETILERLGRRRHRSQNDVMDKVSAKDLMKAAGAKFYDYETGLDFHHCHEWGYSLGGGQLKKNLDPMTRGANYNTLFLIEAPIKKLLMDKKVKKFRVDGFVTFDKDTGLTKKADYCLSWGNQGDYIRVVIDAMSRKRPSCEDNKISNFLFELSTEAHPEPSQETGPGF